MKILLFCTVILTQMLSGGINHARSMDIITEIEDNIVGKRVIINSTILGEKRELRVYLPDSYSKNDKKYPTLYILDGQYLFLNGVSATQTLAEKFDMIPEVIVVGITTNSPERYDNLTGTNFINFLEQDVLSYIDATYRTSEERLIFGWEHAGTLIVQTLITKPHLFDAHIISDPFPLGGDGDNTRVRQLENKLTSKFGGHLYFGVAASSGMVVDGTNELEKVLKEKASNSFIWGYAKLETEEHRTIATPILPLGLRHYFSNYSDLYLSTLDEYKKVGGLKYVREYFKVRADRYGYSPEISTGTMWSMVSRAIIADDFDYFKKFLGEFKLNGFIKGSRIRDIVWYAGYYKKYKKYDDALSLYLEGVEEHDNSPRLFHEMGMIYQVLNDIKNAAIHYKKSIAFAKATNNPQLAVYEKSLASLGDG